MIFERSSSALVLCEEPVTLKDDLKSEVATIFRAVWETRDGTVVPEPDDLKLTNDAVRLDGTVLYADLAESTRLVDAETAEFAAEVYKAYLHCAAKIIRAEGGEITAYDGDRIMAVFLGSTKNTSAVRAGLKINWARADIVNPALEAQYPKKSYRLKQTVGIDTGKLFVARTGIRGSNDLVWVGRPANYAAKLSALDADYPTWITGEVYNTMLDSVKLTNGTNMWEARRWTAMNNLSIYRSNWRWPV
jgi:class 3 adenylate cyclase